ncbi:MAG: PQQ-binding-like beta-propeller repeat protein [Thermoflexales bacterium]|nr:PQQ-binding-like beta-propeller repeat protein [Thermoflexales bacterium]
MGSDNSRVHLDRARHFQDAGQFIEAIEEYSLAVSLEPAALDAWLALGAACRQLGWLADAAFAYRQVLRQDAHNIAAEKMLAALAAPLNRAGEILWSIDLAEKEIGSFCASPNGQRLLLASGGASALSAASAKAKPSGRLHLIDRCGNLQTIARDWLIYQAGLSENGELVYAHQATRSGALVTWIDPATPATPIIQHRLQGGPPVSWKRADDVLIITSNSDPLSALDVDGNVLWQIPHDPCTSIKLQVANDGQTLLAIGEAMRSFGNEVQVHMLGADGRLLWRKVYNNWLSTALLTNGMRTLTACARSIDATNQQGNTIWNNAYRDIIGVQINPDQDTALVQHERGSRLDAIDPWTGHSLWQRADVFPTSIGFATLGKTVVLVLRSIQEAKRKMTLEALDLRSGNTLWQTDLSPYVEGAGTLVSTGDEWVAVILGQRLVTLDKAGKVTGDLRFLTKDLSAQIAPKPAVVTRPGKELLVIEKNRRILVVDRLAHPIWEQAIPCKECLAIPASPYLAVLGTKPSDRHALSMLRLE